MHTDVDIFSLGPETLVNLFTLLSFLRHLPNRQKDLGLQYSDLGAEGATYENIPACLPRSTQ